VKFGRGGLASDVNSRLVLVLGPAVRAICCSGTDISSRLISANYAKLQIVMGLASPLITLNFAYLS
jgi:hypothetical protein